MKKKIYNVSTVFSSFDMETRSTDISHQADLLSASSEEEATGIAFSAVRKQYPEAQTIDVKAKALTREEVAEIAKLYGLI